jgi:hypothetical protein
MCEAGPSAGLIPVKLMAARAFLSIEMHAILFLKKISHDIQLIAAGYHNNKKCEEGEFQKMECLHFTEEKFQPVSWPAREL